MKKSFFDSLFLVNLSVFPWDFVCFEKVICMAIYIVKIEVWNGS